MAQVEGMQELYKKLNALAKSMETGRVEAALLRGAEELRDAAREKAPVGPTGNLRDRIKAFQLPKRGDNPRSAECQSSAQHDHFIEFGTSERYQKTTGRYTGSMERKPFFRPAIDENKERVYNEIVSEMRQAVEDSVK